MTSEENRMEKEELKDFEGLFRDYFQPLCAYAFKYTKDFDSAKEIVHTVFVKVWEKRTGIDKDQNIRSYLYTSVYNRCLNHIRDSRKTVEFDDYHKETIGQDDPANLEAQELQAKIEAAIQSLPDRCREVFILSRYEELKYAKIAERLEISVKTVEVQISKALKLLREHLADFLTIILIFLFR